MEVYMMDLIKIKEIVMNGDIWRKVEEQIAVQKLHGNWNYNSYMHGMLNGMLLVEATAKGTEYEPYNAPKQWIENIKEKENMEKKNG